MYYQQGDLLLHEVKRNPKGGEVRMDATAVGQRVFAKGEQTGHAHVTTDQVELIERGGQLFCRADVPFAVTHEEHKELTVPPGEYRIERVREAVHPLPRSNDAPRTMPVDD